MNWFDYHFIYQDSLGCWFIATNPAFIAEHTKCKAIKKSECSDIAIHLRELNKGRI